MLFAAIFTESGSIQSGQRHKGHDKQKYAVVADLLINGNTNVWNETA